MSVITVRSATWMCRKTLRALPWRVFLGYPACISPVSCLYLTVSLISRVSPPCIEIYNHIFCNRSTVSCCISLLTVSSCIRTYLAVSSCIPLYLIVSHRLENGIWPKIHSRGGLLRKVLRTYVRSPRPYIWRKVEGVKSLKQICFQCVACKSKTKPENKTNVRLT